MEAPWGAIISGAENSMDRIGGTAFSHYWALRNERFQEGQSKTHYQRAIADMQAAGLNPMLAYGQGGASAAQGARASPSSGSRDPGAAFTSAQVAREQVKNMQAQNRLLELEGDKSEVEKTFYRAFLPLAQQISSKLGNWSAGSLKDSPKMLDPPDGSGAAAPGSVWEGVTKWISERLEGIGSWGAKQVRDAHEFERSKEK